MSKLKYHFIGIIIYAAVGISAVMSASYGYMLAGDDASQYEKYIMSAAFAIFDLIIAIFAAETTSKMLTKTAARFLFIVLFALSSLSNAAYMIGQQAKGQGKRVAMLERQIEQYNTDLDKLNPVTRPANYRELRQARERAYNDLQAIIEKQGGEITKANAFFIYSSKITNMDADTLAAITRMIAMLTLNMSGIVLSAWREQSYQPKNTTNHNTAKVTKITKNDEILEQIKKAVISKSVKPSVTAIAKTFCANNRALADYYLKMLEQQNIILNKGHGKKRMILA